ncbi:hypothetical protein PGTUg99_007217 [Puccinia graminis f. sp. tritici]|uniref:Golgi to ER traffic-protein n=1 Tax=Puccinia graminis f. sp. tritici TaxID=56615 RepID=A0A5B0S9S2_PUCGR|nr:hypothetical protein PGTUg99_007217 [Puccinia graminis f. sp. tritici]
MKVVALRAAAGLQKDLLVLIKLDKFMELFQWNPIAEFDEYLHTQKGQKFLKERGTKSTLSLAAALAGSDNDDAQLANLAADLASQVDPVGPTSAQKTKHRPRARSSSSQYASTDGPCDGDDGHRKKNQDGPSATQSAGKEVKLEELQELEKELMETKERMTRIQERIKKTTGFAPKREEFAFSQVTEALDLRLKVFKVKIEEGVSANQEVIVLDDEEEEDPEPIRLPSFKKNKRPAPNPKPSNAVTKKSKTRIAGSSDDEHEDENENDDQDRDADQSGRQKGKGKGKEMVTGDNLPEKVKGVVGLMHKWEPASACILVKTGSASLKEFFRNTLGNLTKNGGNSGRAGHELGVIADNIISNFLDFLASTEPYWPKDQPNIRNNISSQLINFSRSAPFTVFLRSAPALMQVTHPDPFWNPNVVNFDKIYDAAQEEDESPNGSWTSVLAMFTRAEKDNTITYTEHKYRQKQVTTAFTRLDQIIRDSVSAVGSQADPPTATSTDGSQLEGVRKASCFIFNKVTSYGGAADPKDEAKKQSNVGTNEEPLNDFILRRIHELLLALSIANEAMGIEKIEKEYKEAGVLSGNQIKKIKGELQATAIFRHGPPKSTTKNWALARRTSFAALAGFMCYGVAGWMLSQTNNRKYTMADTYGLLTLGDQRLRTIKDFEPTLTHPHPLAGGSWRRLNCHIYKVLHQSNIKRGTSADWIAAADRWRVEFSPAKVGELVLADIIQELQRPTYSITSKGGPALHPVLPVSANDTHDGLLKILEDQLPNLMTRSDYEAAAGQDEDEEMEEGGDVEFVEVVPEDS